MRADTLRRGLALLAAALAAGLLATAVIAVTGHGSQTPPPPGPSAAFAGVQVTSVRLLPLRAPDPQGGPPWGIRLIETSRGWTCAQVGRVKDGRFGELGLDGAFGGDDRLHPPPPGQIPAEDAPGTGPVNDVCQAPGETFAGEIGALDRSAAFGVQERPVPYTDLRRISFGLLGPHALAITYLNAGRKITRRLRAPLGAYLLVQPLTGSRYTIGVGAAPGSDRPGDSRGAGTTKALASLLYRFDGKQCREVRGGHACPATARASAQPHYDHRPGWRGPQ